MKKLKLLDTFSGIGGFSYAAEKLVGGFETTQFIEIDPYCQKVLKKHWPNVPIHDDITTYRAESYSADVICGGFPCQSISQAGNREGITETSRSGIWFQLIRTIRMVRPKYFILENVSAILANGLDIVLRDIYEAGYDAEWCCIPSSFVGACHQRDRWWLVAYSNSKQSSGTEGQIQAGRIFSSGSTKSGNVANSESQFSNVTKLEHHINKKSSTSEFRNSSVTTSNSESKRTWKDESRLWGQSQGGDMQTDRDSNKKTSASSNSNSNGLQREVGSRVYRPTWKTQNIRRINPNWRQYVSEPTIRRGDDGLRNRVDRLKALGNSVVPQVAAISLQRVKDIHEQLTSVDR